ncbi:MAG: relaxase/mobilization nuclease domain-containing protein, partial [Faecalibacterium prausnitzii]|nr:relaxase/mobilization nuclease domain-containing protein [Faecalibacterium prausnitzii]
GNNLAHHLIQAFEPGETTAEQAHEIGRQLADEVLQGKYPYVITTHIDKGHLHNHIIFCAVDMANQRKYISNRQSYAFIRRTSDRLCKEHGLSVVKPGKDKGKTYAEWDAQKKGKSWKAKLKLAIDAAIPQAKDFDSFLRLMEAQGYEVKQGKFISFRAPGQERFTRCKTLGEDYTEERITQRIKGIAIDRGSRRRSAGEISLRIALEDSIKAQQSAGYARWAKLHNLKQAANSLNFIAANDAAASALKDAERRLGDMALLIKNLSAYKQLRPVALELRNAKDKAAFRRQHESQLILYEAAAKTLKEAGVTKLPNLYALKTEYKKLDAERERLSAQYSEAKQKLKEYGIVKQNVDSILRTAPGKEHTQER